MKVFPYVLLSAWKFISQEFPVFPAILGNMCISHFFANLASKAWNSKVTGQIQLEFEPVKHFMPVIVTCKFDEDWIHSNWEKVGTSFSPL